MVYRGGQNVCLIFLCVVWLTSGIWGGIIKICPICGNEFHPKSNRQKYCGDECARMGHREKARIRMQRMNDKRPYGYKHKKMILGSGNLGMTPRDDFSVEAEKILKEMQKFRLKSSIKNAVLNGKTFN